MRVEIKEMRELRVATLPHTGPYIRISETFARLGEIAGIAGLIGPETTMLAVYYDDPATTPAFKLRADAALVVPPDARLPLGFTEKRVPPGRYACTIHIGPYEELGDAWAHFRGEWLAQSGYHMGDGVSYEIYRNTPADTSKEKLKTELYMPVAR